jgi:Flp pilus assembly protein TadG
VKLIRKNKDGERGQSLVEFTMIVPIFLLLVFAIVDFGMGFHAWITVTNSAREGARIGAVGADQSTIEARARDTAGSLDGEDLSVTVTNAQGDPGEAVTVEVDYDYQLITPLSNILGIVSGGSIGPDLNFSATSEMRLE